MTSPAYPLPVLSEPYHYENVDLQGTELALSQQSM